MILTGKSKENFLQWYSDNYLIYFNHYKKKPTLINALIIEWFDSVGMIIHTNIDIETKKWGYELFYIIAYGNLKENDFHLDIPTEYDKFNTRQEATEQAIIQANEIYNKL
jgi:hypothetical protein